MTRHLRRPIFVWAISGLVMLGCPHITNLGFMSEAHYQTFGTSDIWMGDKLARGLGLPTLSPFGPDVRNPFTKICDIRLSAKGRLISSPSGFMWLPEVGCRKCHFKFISTKY